MTTDQLVEHRRAYLANRVATYDMRRARFRAVADALCRMELSPADHLLDLGAGHCQFDYYLRTELEWMGVYAPVDAAIDGTNLDTWEPKVQPDFFVLMEIVEHLHDPMRLLRVLNPSKGVVLTTPNPGTVDVLGCDPDHRSVITAGQLRELGFTVTAQSFFGAEDDTLLAWRKSKGLEPKKVR